MGREPLSQWVVSCAGCSRVGGRNSESPKVYFVSRMVPVPRPDLFPGRARVVFQLADAVRRRQPEPGMPFADQFGLCLFRRLSSPQRRAESWVDVYAGRDRLALGALHIRIPLDLRPTLENASAGG